MKFSGLAATYGAIQNRYNPRFQKVSLTFMLWQGQEYGSCLSGIEGPLTVYMRQCRQQKHYRPNT